MLILLLTVIAALSSVSCHANKIQDAIDLSLYTPQYPNDIVKGALNAFNFTAPEGLRAFWLYVPKNYSDDKPSPLVLYFHGYTGDYMEGVRYNQINDAEEGNFLISFGRGTPSSAGPLSWNGGVCCNFANASSKVVDDVNYARVMVKMIEQAVKVDPTQRYSTGFSNGGYMTERLACEAADLFAAVAADASAVGILPGGQQGLASCDKSFGNSALSVLLIHGTSDSVVPFTGNAAGTPCTLDDTARWVTRLNCSGTVVSDYNDGTFSNILWTKCRNNNLMELMTGRNKDHQWYTASGDNFNLMRYAFNFFKRAHAQVMSAQQEQAATEKAVVF